MTNLKVRKAHYSCDDLNTSIEVPTFLHN
jgi:hypothetical protein